MGFLFLFHEKFLVSIDSVFFHSFDVVVYIFTLSCAFFHHFLAMA